MGYNLLVNGVYWGYNPFTNHLLTSWDIQAPLIMQWPLEELQSFHWPRWGLAAGHAEIVVWDTVMTPPFALINFQIFNKLVQIQDWSKNIPPVVTMNESGSYTFDSAYICPEPVQNLHLICNPVARDALGTSSQQTMLGLDAGPPWLMVSYVYTPNCLYMFIFILCIPSTRIWGHIRYTSLQFFVVYRAAGYISASPERPGQKALFGLLSIETRQTVLQQLPHLQILVNSFRQKCLWYCWWKKSETTSWGW